MANKKNKAQKRILNEIKTQLITQAERWDRKDYYTPLKLEEMLLEQCYKIKGDFLAEKNNLEYEMGVLGTNKMEVLRKIEKLTAYLKKSDRVIESHERMIKRLLERGQGDKKNALKAAEKINKKPKISVVVG